MWARLALRKCAEVGRGVRVKGRVWVHGDGRVVVGDGVLFDAATAPIELHAGKGAELRIGSGAVLEGGASIEAMSSVRLGEGCRVGAFCKVMDNNFHRFDDRRRRPPSSPVVVEEGAVLGPRSILLPGTVVARGEVVPAAEVRTARRRR